MIAGAAAPSTPAQRRRGYMITILGVMWLSPDALMQRLIDSDPVGVIGWRGGLSIITLALYLAWRDRGEAVGRVLRGGWRLIVLSMLYAINSSAFVLAIDLSSVADVLVILAATPLCAAVLAWFVLREVPDKRTSIAILLGGAGVLVAALGGAMTGSPLGITLAIITTVNLAAQFTMLRRWPQVDNVAAVFVGSIFMAVFAFAFGDPMAIEGTSRLWAILLGLALTPVAFTLVTVGPRYIGSAEVSLLMLLETAFGPLWVWLVMGEKPAGTALVGGAIIVLAVMVSASSAFWRTR